MHKKYKILLIIVPIVLILDQITKYLAIVNLKSGKTITVIDGFFNFIYRENKGAAWSFLADTSDSFRVPFFMILTIGAILLVLYMITKLTDKQKLLHFAFPLIVGGASGNLTDRFTNGAVIDFIDWHVGVHHWPTFNVADMALVMAMVLLGLEVIISAINDYKLSKKGEKNEN
jgi:signal peptidase II